MRFAIAINVFLGRSLRSLASEIARRLKDLIGWSFGRLHLRRFAPFERHYFLLRRWHVAAAGAIILQITYLAIRQWKEYTSGRTAQRRRLKTTMLHAPDYISWHEAASQLERLSGRNPIKQSELEGRLYDRNLVQQRIRHLGTVRQRGDVAEMMFALRSDLLRNLGNMASSNLHETLIHVPGPIRDYIDEVRTYLYTISSSSPLSSPFTNIPPIDDRLAFLRETRHAFGRTALVLSGGGSFGSYHLGVVDALLSAGLLPRVLSGSSAGAIVAALICTRTPQELEELFADLPARLQGIELYASNTAVQVLRHLVLKGTLQDHSVLQERLQRLLGDVTFQEAYVRSGRILNVSVTAADTSEPPRLLNYLTAPNVIVWSAVACSSAFPFLFAPQTLLARDSKGHVVPFANPTAGEMLRRWRDGSLQEDLPMNGLSEMFNVNYFLVSQCNPYLLPIIALKRAMPRTLGILAEQEFKHRCKQLMEILPSSFGGSRVLKLLSQPWEGDITMVLPASSFSTLKAVVNLSKDDLLRSLAEGHRAAWAKLPAIAANCDIEVTLDACLRSVTAAARRARARLHRRASSVALASLHPSSSFMAGGTGGMRAGIPSWLHLQALGLVHSESVEAFLGGGGGGSLDAQTPRESCASPTMASTTLPASPTTTSALHFAQQQQQQYHRVVSSNRNTATAMASMPRPPSSYQVDLTDTIMPEDSELPCGDDNTDGTTDGIGGIGLGPTLNKAVPMRIFGEREDDQDEDEQFGIMLTEIQQRRQRLQQAPPPPPPPPFGEEEEMEMGGGGLLAGTRAVLSMSMGCGDDVWRDLFEVVPATTSAGDALDYIAP